MQLIVLGSGTALPVPDRGPAGYLVSTPDTLLLLDCGSGTLGRLARMGIHPKMLSGIFLSHAHPDHIADLLPLLFSLRMPGCELDLDLPLYTSTAFTPYLNGLRATFGDWMTPKGASLIHHPIDEGRFQVGSLLCRVAPVLHHPTSIGVRIQDPDDATLAYLGDCDLCPGATSLAHDVDLALVECTLPDAHSIPGHMTPQKVATLAREAAPHALLLTHLSPPLDPADPHPLAALLAHGCLTPATLAEDGMGVRIGDPLPSGHPPEPHT
jgi:ribonuclease BN (tRNA processing enzyme)